MEISGQSGAVIDEKFPGVYDVSGISPFPVQILVGRQLDPKEKCTKHCEI